MANGVIGCTNLPRKAENQEEDDIIRKIAYMLKQCRGNLMASIQNQDIVGCVYISELGVLKEMLLFSQKTSFEAYLYDL